MDDLNFTSSNSFLHHGIQGQKWGIQNGPPYPLDKEEHKQVVKSAKKEYKKTRKEAMVAIGKESADYERSRFRKGNHGMRRSDPDLFKKANDLVIAAYNKKIEYKEVKKGEEWVNKHKDDVFVVGANNVTKYYYPKQGTIHTVRAYYY